MTAAKLTLEMLIVLAVGCFIEKRRVVSEKFNADLSAFVIKIALPCLIIESMQMEYSVEQLRTCGYLLLVGLLFLAVSFAVAFLLRRVPPRDYRGRIFRFSIVFTNVTFMGIPVMEALYGSYGLFCFVIFLVPLRIALYVCAKPLLTPGHTEEKGSLRQKIKGVFSPPLVGVIVGLALYLTGWELPEIVHQPIRWLYAVCSPMGMVLCGMSLAKYPARALLRKSCILIAGLRCLVMPALFLGLSFLLGLSPDLARPLVICAALPVASTLTVFTVRYDSNTEAHFESAGAILCSALLSAGTIPLWAWLLTFLK